MAESWWRYVDELGLLGDEVELTKMLREIEEVLRHRWQPNPLQSGTRTVLHRRV
jgi:hypothetical protein